MRKFVALVCFVLFLVRIGEGVSLVQVNDWEDDQIAKQKNWVAFEFVEAEEQIDFLVALRLRNTDRFTSILMDVSDPKSSNYGMPYFHCCKVKN